MTFGTPLQTIPQITNVPGFYDAGPDTVIATADKAIDAANTFLITLGTGSANLVPPVINPEFPTAGAAPSLITTTPPAFGEIIFTVPAMPPAFTGALSVDDLFFDTFDAVQPTLIIPAAPDFTGGDIPDAPGLNLDFVIPDLTLTLPVKPDLISISISPFDGVNFPTLDAAAPTLDLVAPSIREYVPGSQYTSSLLTSLKASLEDRIVNGGTGLGQDGETAIWDRGREREFRSQADALAELEKMEAQGFTLPTGAYIDARIKLATETDYASRGHSREVMAQSAQLELDQVNHSLTTAVAMESQSMTYSNQVEQRLFDSCKYATEAGISIYNAGVQAFGVRMEGYKAAIQAYSARIQAEVAKVDAYKAQVEAEQAKVEVNRALVQMYQADISAALANVDVFKARVAAIQAQADIEKTKIEIYGEQVKAFVAKANVYTAQVEGFRARISGEQTKQDAYKTSVDAFSARVGASAKLIDARIAAYQGQLQGYTAQWDGFKAAAQAEAARVGALAQVETAEGEVYKATVQGVTSYNEVLTKQWQAILDQNQQIAQIGIQAAKANSELYVSTRSLALDAAKVGAQVSAQQAAAALSVLHFSASFSESRSDSNSNSASNATSQSQSESVSNSVGTSTNTNYNYSV